MSKNHKTHRVTYQRQPHRMILLNDNGELVRKGLEIVVHTSGALIGAIGRDPCRFATDALKGTSEAHQSIKGGAELFPLPVRRVGEHAHMLRAKSYSIAGSLSWQFSLLTLMISDLTVISVVLNPQQSVSADRHDNDFLQYLFIGYLLLREHLSEPALIASRTYPQRLLTISTSDFLTQPSEQEIRDILVPIWEHALYYCAVTEPCEFSNHFKIISIRGKDELALQDQIGYRSAISSEPGAEEGDLRNVQKLWDCIRQSVVLQQATISDCVVEMDLTSFRSNLNQLTTPLDLEALTQLVTTSIENFEEVGEPLAKPDGTTPMTKFVEEVRKTVKAAIQAELSRGSNDVLEKCLQEMRSPGATPEEKSDLLQFAIDHQIMDFWRSLKLHFESMRLEPIYGFHVEMADKKIDVSFERDQDTQCIWRNLKKEAKRRVDEMLDEFAVSLQEDMTRHVDQVWEKLPLSSPGNGAKSRQICFAEGNRPTHSSTGEASGAAETARTGSDLEEEDAESADSKYDGEKECADPKYEGEKVKSKPGSEHSILGSIVEDLKVSWSLCHTGLIERTPIYRDFLGNIKLKSQDVLSIFILLVLRNNLNLNRHLVSKHLYSVFLEVFKTAVLKTPVGHDFEIIHNAYKAGTTAASDYLFILNDFDPLVSSVMEEPHKVPKEKLDILNSKVWTAPQFITIYMNFRDRCEDLFISTLTDVR